MVDYLYDLENRWIGKSIDYDGDGLIDSQEGYVYDGNQIVLQFERDLSGATGCLSVSALSAADLTHRYLWQPDAVDQLMADEQITDEVVWALTDQLGTVRDLAVMDIETGETSVVNHITYDTYGQKLNETNAAVDCLFAFTSRAFDEATEIQNNLNRWYDAKVGRWLSKDPISFEGRDANTYRYCGNDPVNRVDPDGLFDFWIKTNTGDTYTGDTSSEFLAALNAIGQQNQKIRTMYLLGHGCSAGITGGMWSSTYLINAIYDDAGKLIQVPDEHGNMQVVTPLLRSITDKNTQIFLRACTSSTLAKNMSMMLPGVKIEGCHTPAFHIPFTWQAISILPGNFTWQIYCNGEWINVPPPGYGELPPM